MNQLLAAGLVIVFLACASSAAATEPAVKAADKDADKAVEELFKWVTPAGNFNSFFQDQISDAIEDVRKAKATEAAVTKLVEVVKARRDRSHWRAVYALRVLGPEAKTAVPTLTELLQQKPANVEALIFSTFYADALGEIGPDAKAAVPTLTEALKHENAGTRVEAALALWKIDKQAKTAVPALVAGLKDPKAANAAARALGQLGPEARDAVPALRDALSSDNAYTRGWAALALWKIDKQADVAVPILVKMLNPSSKNEPDQLNTQVAAQHLGEIGPDAKEAVPALKEALKSEAARARIAAALALWKIDKQNSLSVDALAKELGSASTAAYDRKDAAKALGEIGPAAKPAVPALREATKSEDEGLRKAALRALQRIEGG